MPFRSLSQMRKFHAMEARGEIAKGTSRKWADETPNMKALPKKVSKKKKNPKKSPLDAVKVRTHSRTLGGV